MSPRRRPVDLSRPPALAPREYVDSIFGAMRQIDRMLDRATRDAGYAADIVNELRDLDDSIWALAGQVEEFGK